MRAARKRIGQARHYFLELKVCGSRPQNARKFKAKSPNGDAGGKGKAATSHRAETICSIDRLFLLLIGDPQIKVLEPRILQPGTAGKHVPFGCLHRIGPGAERLNVEMRHLVLRHDVATLGRPIKPTETLIQIALAAETVDQPDAEIDLRGIVTGLGGPRQPVARLGLLSAGTSFTDQ